MTASEVTQAAVVEALSQAIPLARLSYRKIYKSPFLTEEMGGSAGIPLQDGMGFLTLTFWPYGVTVRLKGVILGVGTPTVLGHLVLGLDLDRKAIVLHREGSFGTVSHITTQWICTYAETLIAKLSTTIMEKVKRKGQP